MRNSIPFKLLIAVLAAIGLAVAAPTAWADKPPDAPAGVAVPPALSTYDLSRLPQAFDTFAPIDLLYAGWDDGSQKVDLPFSFRLFGYDYTSVYVSANGMLNFTRQDNGVWDSAAALRAKLAVAPLWNDWANGEVYYTRLADRVVLTWLTSPYCELGCPPSLAEFQAVLYTDGRVQFNYRTNTSGLGGAVGLATAEAPTAFAWEEPSTNNIDSYLFTPRPLADITTAIFLNGTQLVDNWFSTDVNVTLSPGAGAGQVVYSLDGGLSWTTYAGPFVLSAHGSTLLWARALDPSGVPGLLGSVFVPIDQSPLVTRVQAGQGGLDWLTPSVMSWQWSNRCQGCHVQGVSLFGLATSASTGYQIDQSSTTGTGFLATDIASSQQADGHFSWWPTPNVTWGQNTLAATAGMGLAGFDRYLSTSKSQNLVRLANWIVNRQQGGRWSIDWSEAPVGQGDMMVTGSFMYILSQARERVDSATATLYQAAINQAADWFRATPAVTNQDKAFALVGMKSAGLSDADPGVSAYRAALLATQLADGSWRERGGLPSGSAYATGQTLYALCLAGVGLNNPQVELGINWLIHSQGDGWADGQYFDRGPWGEGLHLVNTDAERPSQFLSTIWPVVALGCYGQLGVQVGTSPQMQIINAGSALPQTVQYTVLVTNTANVNDTISLAVSGGMSGWSASLDRTDFNLDSGQTGSAILTIVAPPNLPPGMPVPHTLIATSQTASSVSAKATVTTRTNPPPPTSGNATQTSITVGDGVTKYISDTIRLAATVTDQTNGFPVCGPGRGAVVFVVAGMVVGVDTDNDHSCVFEITWQPGWFWNYSGEQDLRALYAGITLSPPNANLMPSYAAGSLTLIRPSNVGPTANADGPYTITMGSGVTLNGSGSRDPDTSYGDAMSFAWDIDNDGAFDDSTAISPTLTWAGIQSLGLTYPGDPATGLPRNPISLRVTDRAGASSIANTSLLILSPNRPPVMNPIPGATVESGTLFSYTVTAVDPDAGQTITYTLTASPPGAIIAITNGTINWTPDWSNRGANVFVVRATDSGAPVAFASTTFTITVVDTISPVTTATSDYNLAGGEWTSSTVAILLSAVDNPGGSGVAASSLVLDGVAQPGNDVSISGEGFHQIEYWSADLAGNVEVSRTAQIRIDKTPPVISGATDLAPNAAGWYSSSVSVHFTCTDALSGIASCTDDVVLTGDGAGQSVGGTAVDNAGNVTDTTVSGINIDLTPPAISGAPTTSPNANGWYSGSVTVHFTCSDGPSGVASCPDDVVISTAGADQSVTGTAVDNAGNSASATVSGINIDLTRPALTVERSPLANAKGWNNVDVTAHFSATDALSGVPVDSFFDVFFTLEGAGQSATHTFYDNAGNAGSATLLDVNIDKTAPTLTGAPTTSPNANGWYSGSVTIRWTAGDGLSGLDLLTIPADSVITGEGGGLAASASVSDNAGNRTETVTAMSIQIDRTPPVITGAPTTPPNANGWYSGPVTVHFTCTDALSGIASCTDDVVLTDDGAGQSVSGTAVDNAGNSSSTTVGGINIDRTPPALSGVATTAPNANGWYTANVTVHWSSSDTGSGIDPATLPGDSIIDGDGIGLTASASVADLAGNTTSATLVPPVDVDQTRPTISGGPTTSPNGAGWYAAPVLIDFTCADNLSGIALCGPDTYVTSSGAGQGATGWAQDNAGNFSIDGVTISSINVDLTPPVITYTLSPPSPNATGWYTGPVTVHFICTDADSGIATCPGDVVLSSDGAGQSASGTTVDNAGNSASVTATGINIDLTPPAISGAPTTSPNANGWYSGSVTVHFTCSDGPSGVASCPADVVISTAGANQSVTGTAVDNAGNRASATVSGINIDLTRPAVTVERSPLANAKGWNNVDVTAHFSATDALSGVPVDSFFDVFFTLEGAGQSATRTFYDNAGNAGSATLLDVNIDKTAPTLTGAPTTSPNANGWYSGSVTIRWTAGDGLSGLDPLTIPADSVITGEGGGLAASASVSDNAGNRTETVTAMSIQIDRTPPVITGAPTTPPNANGWYSGSVTVHFTCTDALSGIASCPADVVISSGGPNQSVTGTAVDNAGNSSTTTVGGINIDLTPPAISGAPTTSPNANGWYNGAVTVHFTCSDGPSAVASCPADVVISTAGANQSVTGTATDRAGNSASATVSGISIDLTPPVITGAPTTSPNASGWYTAAVTVHFTCSDSLSGIASCSPDAMLSADGSGLSTVGTALDYAGNSSSVTVSGINIDKTPPVTTPSSNPPAGIGGLYAGGTRIALVAVDNLSGVAGTQYDLDGAGWRPYVNPIGISGSGTHTVTYRSTDRAGNTEAVQTLTVPVLGVVVFNQFDPVTKDVMVIQSDPISGTVIGPVVAASVVPVTWGLEDEAGDDGGSEGGQAELRTYRIVDAGGGVTVLVEKVKKRGTEIKVHVVSVQYPNGPVVTFPRNAKMFEWSLQKDGSVMELEQKMVIWQPGDKQEVDAKYDSKKRRTTIRVKESENNQILRAGISLLRMVVKSGKLSIEY